MLSYKRCCRLTHTLTPVPVASTPIGLKCLYNGAEKQPRRLLVFGEDEWLGNTRLGARNQWATQRREVVKKDDNPGHR
jgi:hypothetical protein